MKWFSTLVFSLFVSLAAQATASLDFRIIGNNDLITVNTPALNVPGPFRRLVNAMGMISMGCTATHIGGGIVLTAGHCFDATPRVQENRPCPDVTVSWGFRGDQRSFLVSRCVNILAMQQSDDADWAIFRVDRAPRDYVAVDTQATLAIFQPVTIFSHPNMESLKWSRFCRIVRPIPFPYSAKSMYHQCDTNPGSSGATVIDAQTLRVIGIHDGGNERVNYGTPIRAVPLSYVLLRNRTALPPAPTE